ncbi:MAG: HDIG domain-containing metalloprotein [Planctomycetota bacterium]
MSTRPPISKTSSVRTARLAMELHPSAKRSLLGRSFLAQALTGRRILAAMGLVLLLLLPRFWGPRLIPYHLNQRLHQPIFARLGFIWKDPKEEERIRKEIEEGFTRFYQEDPNWIDNVFGPVRVLLNRANALAASQREGNAAAEELQAFAKTETLDIRPEEIEAILAQLGNKERSAYFYYDIIDPAYRTLKNNFFGLGILSDADHLREQGRRIHVLSPGIQVQSSPIGTEGGVMSLSASKRRLKKDFDEVFTRLDPDFLAAYTAILARRLQPTFTYLEERSQAALEKALQDRIVAAQLIQKGDELASADKPLTRADLARIRREAEVFESQHKETAALARFAGMIVLLGIAALGFLLYLARFEEGVLQKGRRLIGVLLLAIAVLWLLQIGMMMGLPVSLAPIGVVGGVAALLLGPRAGVGTASLLTFATFLVTQAETGELMALLGSSWAFACLVPGVRRRSGLLRAAALAGCLSFLGTLFFRLASGWTPSWDTLGKDIPESLSWIGAWDLLTWVLGGGLLTLVLPLLERVFGAVTNVTLLELSDQEHPCLRRLILDAPGTYHHSVVVGNLAEAAAEAIGAHSLLARVASYYHDIGKLMKPEYFSENDAGRSRHDDLSPTISTLIITAHVKDGAELARAFDLPQDIIDIIEQHHGDSVVPFFYHRARELAEDPDSVSDGAFRYPGPRPQSREAALVFLADSVEAASRSLEDPTPAHIDRLVHEIVLDKLMAHQLDECPLTFRDLSALERAFVRTLNAIFHSRVRYPEGARQSGRKPAR